ncbi:oligosaccharide flippase family protein [Bacillus aerolatus]|uniref:Oligosaccharide flippase family protein n=1 Tax=Bacillus aerolatus TaxID=2653354 RepID=A0A6I1FG32_9BACI|nr:polysaccharide biosynthesis protein [Bacillus aerolatus]KAB7704304.1 oligosaccharide flippase family protein [Bacillus aerolatus]
MLPSREKNSLMWGAVILTMAAIFVKILSAVYRIPFQNIVGDVGFYIYQQVYPFYGIAVALATYGFPVIISKLIAESAENPQRRQEVIRLSYYVTGSISVFLWAAVFFGSRWISNVMGDSSLQPLLQITAFSFLFIPFLTVWRGMFQGEGNMVPTAMSQAVEQTVRVGAILLFSYLLIEQGASLYAAGTGAFAGSLAGGVAAMAVLFYFTRKSGPTHKEKLRLRNLIKTKETKTLFIQGAAICLSGMAIILFQLMDSLNLYHELIKAGAGEWEAKITKGIYDRGQPLLQLGTTVAASLALTIVPLVTSAYRRNLRQELDSCIQLALKVSFTFGLAAAAGLINIMDAVNAMLFENSEGSFVLSLFCSAILFGSLTFTLSGILQGLGNDFIPALAVLTGVILKYIGNMVFVPAFGTTGAAAATVIAFCWMVVFLTASLRKKWKTALLTRETAGKAVFAALCMTAALQVWRWAIDYISLPVANGRLAMAGIALSSVVIGAFVFIYTIAKVKLFTEEELHQIPFGSKLRKRVS